MKPQRFLDPDYALVYACGMLSLAGTVFYMFGDQQTVMALLSERWSLAYFVVAPFIHGGVAHLLVNTVTLHFMGGDMLMPLIGKRRLLILLILGACVGNVANNVMSDSPAIGISGGLMAVVACMLYPYGKLPIRLVYIHGIFRVRPFLFREIIAFFVLIDVCAIVADFRLFAHWAHLGGFATGLAFGYAVFKGRLF